MARDPDLSGEALLALFRRLAARDPAAFGELWSRLEPRLRAWTGRRLRQEPGLRSIYQVDDALQDSFLCMRKTALEGHTPPPASEADFVRLYITIAGRAIAARAVREKRLCRVWKAPRPNLPEALDLLAADCPSPEMAVLARDQLQSVLDHPEPELRTIAAKWLDGFTHDRIARELGQSPRTITRKLSLIRDIMVDIVYGLMRGEDGEGDPLNALAEGAQDHFGLIGMCVRWNTFI